MLLLVGGMLYFIIARSQVKTQSDQLNNVTAPTAIQPTKSPEEKEVEAIDVNDDASTELEEVEKDLQGL